MNYTLEQIGQLFFRAFSGVNTPDISSLSSEEKLDLAQNSKTSPGTLDRLAADEDIIVRCNVALNPNTLPKTLARLAGEEDGRIRSIVARNTYTLPETLARLAKDEDWWVRYWVACNPKTSIWTLDCLADGDIDPTVRLTARSKRSNREPY